MISTCMAAISLAKKEFDDAELWMLIDSVMSKHGIWYVTERTAITLLTK